jgi:hypothetical protein
MVRQETNGYLLTHYAISALICKAAAEAGIDPDRVKLKRTVRIVRRRAADPAAFPPDHRGTHPRQRHGRRHQEKAPQPEAPAPDLPRVVKQARHNSYRVKRPGDHGTRHHGPATISLVSHRGLTLAA